MVTEYSGFSHVGTKRKISAMYEWTGGTDYRHTCGECRSCVKIKKGKKEACKCVMYGDTFGGWNTSYVACKAFSNGRDQPKRRKNLSGSIEGQMSLEEDFPDLIQEM